MLIYITNKFGETKSFEASSICVQNLLHIEEEELEGKTKIQMLKNTPATYLEDISFTVSRESHS